MQWERGANHGPLYIERCPIRRWIKIRSRLDIILYIFGISQLQKRIGNIFFNAQLMMTEPHEDWSKRSILLPTLANLHWLPGHLRCNFKVLLLLHCLAPSLSCWLRDTVCSALNSSFTTHAKNKSAERFLSGVQCCGMPYPRKLERLPQLKRLNLRLICIVSHLVKLHVGLFDCCFLCLAFPLCTDVERGLARW